MAPAPRPQTVASELVERVNEIRLMRAGDEREHAIGTVEFRGKGLRRADPPGYVAHCAMVASLKCAQEDLRACAREIAEKPSDDAEDHLNIARSYITLSMFDDAITVIERTREIFNLSTEALNWVVMALVNCGDFDRARQVIEDEGRRIAPQIQEILHRIDSVLLDPNDLRDAILSGQSAIAAEGWPTPTAYVVLPAYHRMLDVPAIMLGFQIGATPEEAIAVEESMYAAFERAEQKAYMQGTVNFVVEAME